MQRTLFSMMALLLLAGLGLISKDICEAANADGASKFRQFVSMTLASLRTTLDALRVVDVFQIVLAQSRCFMARAPAWRGLCHTSLSTTRRA